MKLEDQLLRIDANQATINEHRPLAPEEVRELDEYYKIGTTYSSNALEGNSLTLTETKVLLEDGITVGGKPLKDLMEATGHAAAYDFMLSVARAGTLSISEDTIRTLHRILYKAIEDDQAGEYRSQQVYISGTEYIPPSPDEVPGQMATFINQLAEAENTMHPVLLAAYAHRCLVDIHPFIDGNGRAARLLMNLILVNKGYCIVSIPPVLRVEYISSLVTAQRAENPNDEPFNSLILECELEAQRDYARLLKLSL